MNAGKPVIPGAPSREYPRQYQALKYSLHFREIHHRRRCNRVSITQKSRNIAWRGREGHFIDILTELETWYEGENGRYLLASLQEALGEVLATSFGYHILQLGLTRNHPLCEQSRINHRIYACPAAGGAVSLVCECDELPLESDSVDVLIIHHGLEFAARPHQVLREAQRVLTPQGQLLVIGFNPWSLQGVSSRLRGLFRGSFWHQQRFVSESRLTDWLHLLGCEVESRTRLHHIPLWGSGGLRQWLSRLNRWCDHHNLPVGSVYLVHAIKQVSGRNRPQRVRPSTRQRLIGLAVPNPTPSPIPAVPATRQRDVAA